ncbi:hypothetical protein DMENIID0001_135960 [Sergentomyia squamirostris]
MNVQWNNHLQSLGTEFPRMLTTQRFVDVTLACEGRRIHCHRVVLAACSSYFEDLLEENPAQHPIIILPKDVKFWMLQTLVDFMYRGEVSVPEDVFEDLLKIAELLQIKGFNRNPPDGLNDLLDEIKMEDVEIESISPNVLLEIEQSNDDEIITQQAPINPPTVPEHLLNQQPHFEPHSSHPVSRGIDPPHHFNIRLRHNASYSQRDMYNALMSIRSGMSGKESAKIYKVPKTTLLRYAEKFGVRSIYAKNEVSSEPWPFP